MSKKVVVVVVIVVASVAVMISEWRSICRLECEEL